MLPRSKALESPTTPQMWSWNLPEPIPLTHVRQRVFLSYRRADSIGLKAGGRLSDEAAIDDAFGSPAELGRLFLSDHLLAFEITSIVLLVAAVGGVVLGAHSRRGLEEASEPS